MPGDRPVSSAALSRVRGSTDEPLSEGTVHGLLRTAAARWPQREAVVFREQGLRLSWQQLVDEVELVAAGLWGVGLRRGDRVGIWSPNRIEWLLTQFATARIGAILVGINSDYQLPELEYALRHTGASLLVTPTLKSSKELGNLSDGCEGDAARLPGLRTVVHMGGGHVPGMRSWSDLMALGRKHIGELPSEAMLGCGDPISIQFTSGTTGPPKAVTLTHHGIVNTAIAASRQMRLGEADVLCTAIPLHHCFGMVLSVLTCVASGAKMVFAGENFDPLATLSAVEDERCTALHGVPAMFVAALAHPEFALFDLSTLRTGIVGGAPCPIEVLRRVQRDMHMTEVTVAYGTTETLLVTFQCAPDDTLERRAFTVGRVLPHIEVKIVDEDGRIVPTGQMGELCIRGYSVMQGYWGDPVATADAVRDGWMHTGDLAMLDEEGYCHIMGRVRDLVIRGGESIHPREVEELLFRHPKVAAVQVFGVPDKLGGEALCAWIIAKPSEACTEHEIRAFCREHEMRDREPHYIRLVDDLPVTVTGKPQKFLMRELMMRELQRAAAEPNDRISGYSRALPEGLWEKKGV